VLARKHHDLRKPTSSATVNIVAEVLRQDPANGEMRLITSATQQARIPAREQTATHSTQFEMHLACDNIQLYRRTIPPAEHCTDAVRQHFDLQL
jgi:hypothetical protein